ncbi:GNAT family N-acetyltransferase [Bordetella genomosp. 6]|uniref:GNAT family N-acetyltransferase n=1 Tax=Bordetella genomosp. 6 TaxID=463024 RepID=UPI001FCA2FA3|nr:GNAT family N-acetyltransferase [Bordetella genomosp. 6]
MTASELALRTARQDDLQWIVAAHAQVYAAEFGFDRRFRDGIAAKMAALRRRPSAFDRIWVGWVDDERAASIAVSELPGGIAFLNFVLVLPRYRGRGAGRTLMETALAHARAHGSREVQLETYSCLVDARALYHRLGFRATMVAPGRRAYGQTFDQEFWALALQPG